MYHSNFITIFLPKIFYKKIFWNIRHTKLNNKFSKKKTIFISIICGLFSKFIPKKIVYCSEESIKFHENYHLYSKKRTVLINNGFSDNDYYPSKNLRLSFRKKNKIGKSQIILGFAGRYAKEKNINSLLFAYANIIKNYDKVYLYMVGKNINLMNKDLKRSVCDLKIQSKVFFLGEQKNLLEFYNGIDLLILSSHSESFPNVVAEAMLCQHLYYQVMQVVQKIIGEYGFIMSKNDYLSVSKHLDKCLNILIKVKKWKLLRQNFRLKLKRLFNGKMADIYLKNWILSENNFYLYKIDNI